MSSLVSGWSVQHEPNPPRTGQELVWSGSGAAHANAGTASSHGTRKALRSDNRSDALYASAVAHRLSASSFRATPRSACPGASATILAVLRGGSTAPGADPLAVELFDGFLQGSMLAGGRRSRNRVKDEFAAKAVERETRFEAQHVRPRHRIEVAFSAIQNQKATPVYGVGRGLGHPASSCAGAAAGQLSTGRHPGRRGEHMRGGDPSKRALRERELKRTGDLLHRLEGWAAPTEAIRRRDMGIRVN